MRYTGLLSLMFALVVSAVLPPGDAGAQIATGVPRFEFGLAATNWRLDGGTASASPTALWGASMRLGIRPLADYPRALLEAGAFYAPADQGGLEPGVSGLDLGFSVSVVPPSRRPRTNLSFSFGYAVLHFDAEELKQALERCRAAEFCLFEGIMYRTGWRSAIVGGASLDFYITPALPIRLGADLLAPIGSGGGSDSGNHMRYGIGVAWRL